MKLARTLSRRTVDIALQDISNRDSVTPEYIVIGKSSTIDGYRPNATLIATLTVEGDPSSL